MDNTTINELYIFSFIYYLFYYGVWTLAIGTGGTITVLVIREWRKGRYEK